jgi:hypothetical protein
MIASLLIFFFEMQQGDGDTAVKHLHATLPMVEKKLSSCSLPLYAKESSPALPKVECELFSAFLRAARLGEGCK